MAGFGFLFRSVTNIFRVLTTTVDHEEDVPPRRFKHPYQNQPAGLKSLVTFLPPTNKASPVSEEGSQVVKDGVSVSEVVNATDPQAEAEVDVTDKNETLDGTIQQVNNAVEHDKLVLCNQAHKELNSDVDAATHSSKPALVTYTDPEKGVQTVKVEPPTTTGDTGDLQGLTDHVSLTDLGPHYGGKQEIWDALREIQLARAIVSSAGIIVQNADMTLCYDERGLYVLSEPTNRIYIYVKLIVLHKFVGTEYEKNPFEGAQKKTVKASDSVSSVFGGGLDTLPREDYSGKITLELLESSDWKVMILTLHQNSYCSHLDIGDYVEMRLEATVAVNKIIEEANNRIQPARTVELFGAFRARLYDSNQSLIMATLTSVSGLASSMGPAIEKSNKGIVNFIGNNKKHTRECTFAAFDSWVASTDLDKRVQYLTPMTTDGNKSAFAAEPLPIENKEFVIVPEKHRRQHEFVVTKDIDHLRYFLSGRQHDNPQETIQALDIVLRKAASHERIIVGRSLFSTVFGMGPLGNGVDYCRGFYQSNIDMSNAQQAETCQPIRMLSRSYDLLDLLKSFKIGRQKEIQSLLEKRPVSNFAHRNGLPSFLKRGRFLRFVQSKNSTSVVAASELGLSKQTHTVSVSDLRKGLLSRAEVCRNSDDSSNNKLELGELSSRRRVSNLLQSGFGLRLDQLLRKRQEKASQSDDEWMLEGAHSLPPAIQQQSGTEWEIINGLRIDMVRLQEEMNSMQSTLETCKKKMQLEQQHSGTEWEIINGPRMDMVRLQEQMNSMQSTLETCKKKMQLEQEVSSALSRLSTSDEDSLETSCFLCCDNTSSDYFSPDRCGRVHVCSNCANKINWPKLRESVRHP